MFIIVPGTVLGAGDTPVNKTGRLPSQSWSSRKDAGQQRSHPREGSAAAERAGERLLGRAPLWLGASLQGGGGGVGWGGSPPGLGASCMPGDSESNGSEKTHVIKEETLGHQARVSGPDLALQPGSRPEEVTPVQCPEHRGDPSGRGRIFRAGAPARARAGRLPHISEAAGSPWDAPSPASVLSLCARSRQGCWKVLWEPLRGWAWRVI
uniref:Uncharacterized protein n=1 Tax=Rousettus aegyptiacus TaxID=9407 RepID=A0A7J8DIE0_ROUAE|nr:hypothetical protein HJG63_008514 [Rousettus aegyptiacus]